MMPGSQKTKNLYEKMTRQYLMDANSIESIENEYINEDTSDPHVMKPLIKFGDILEEQGIDPYIQRTTLGSFGEFLVVFDAGSVMN